jgi:hypothetical protein
MLRKKKSARPDPIAKEIKTEERKEKIKLFLVTHKRTILILILAIIVLIIVAASIKTYQRKQEENYSAVLQQILIDSETNPEAAKTSLKKLYEDKSAPAGTKSLASLKYAAVLMKEAKTDEAVAIYLEINKTKKYDAYIKELSGLLALKTLIDTNKPEFEDKIINLTAELEKNSKSLKYYVTEQKAVFEWNRGNHKIAGEIFKNLAENTETSQAVKARAKEMYDIYTSKYSAKEVAPKSNIEEKAAAK